MSVSDVRHLTWRGRLSWAYYRLRSLFVAPASDGDRCFMGGPIGEHVQCPQRAAEGEIWCPHHGGRADA